MTKPKLVHTLLRYQGTKELIVQTHVVTHLLLQLQIYA